MVLLLKLADVRYIILSSSFLVWCLHFLGWKCRQANAALLLIVDLECISYFCHWHNFSLSLSRQTKGSPSSGLLSDLVVSRCWQAAGGIPFILLRIDSSPLSLAPGSCFHCNQCWQFPGSLLHCLKCYFLSPLGPTESPGTGLVSPGSSLPCCHFL